MKTDYSDLIAKLETIKEQFRSDPEVCHIEADRALLDFIDNAEVTELHAECAKWYA